MAAPQQVTVGKTPVGVFGVGGLSLFPVVPSWDPSMEHSSAVTAGC